MSDNQSIRSGKCPKCGSYEVYTDRNLPNRGYRQTLPVSSLKYFALKAVICLNCGYFEEYIPESELKDKKTIEKLKSTWEKVI